MQSWSHSVTSAPLQWLESSDYTLVYADWSQRTKLSRPLLARQVRACSGEIKWVFIPRCAGLWRAYRNVLHTVGPLLFQQHFCCQRLWRSFFNRLRWYTFAPSTTQCVSRDSWAERIANLVQEKISGHVTPSRSCGCSLKFGNAGKRFTCSTDGNTCSFPDRKLAENLGILIECSCQAVLGRHSGHWSSAYSEKSRMHLLGFLFYHDRTRME